MKSLYFDPLIPRGECAEATLRRLSSNLGTLTGLIADAERAGHLYLAGMFSRSRDTKVAVARAIIALAKEGNANGIEKAVVPSLNTKGGQRHAADNKVSKHGERPEVEVGFFPAEALLLMDIVAVRPERRFLLVGTALVGVSTASLTSRHPRRGATRFALVDEIFPSSRAKFHLSARQAP